MEVFADEFWLVAVAILFVGGVSGAVVVGDTVPQSLASLMDGAGLWIVNRLAGAIVGTMAAFLCIDVPLTFAVAWLKKSRPELFQPRRG